jgi:hypothetical protein
MTQRKIQNGEVFRLHLVKMQEDEDLTPSADEKDKTLGGSKSGFVRQMNSFADELDLMIENIMKI